MKFRWICFLVVFSSAFCSEDSLAEKLTIITSTSLVPSNPSTKMLEVTQKSLDLIPGFSKCHRIIVFDGVFHRQKHREEAYNAYKQNVIALTKTHPAFANTTLVFCKEHKHLARALEEGMKHVKTPFIFVHQHDFKINKPVDSFGIIRSMEENPNLKHIRLNRKWNKATNFDFCVDEKIDGVSYVPLCRTFGWSDNDHFTRKDYYENFVFPKIKRNKPMEYFLNPLERAMTKKDPNQHLLFGTYLYGTKKDGNYLAHLDGKRWKS